jgi:hypothetical protein
VWDTLTEDAQATLTRAAGLAADAPTDTRHLLLALLDPLAADTRAGQALRAAGLDPTAVRSAARTAAPEPGRHRVAPDLLATDPLTDVLLRARHAAGPDPVTTADLLGALTESEHATGADLITGLDVPLRAVQAGLFGPDPGVTPSRRGRSPDLVPARRPSRPGVLLAVAGVLLAGAAVVVFTLVQPQWLGVLLGFAAAAALTVGNRWAHVRRLPAAISLVVAVLLMVYGGALGGVVLLGLRGAPTAVVITANTDTGRARECRLRTLAGQPVAPDTTPCDSTDRVGSRTVAIVDPDGRVEPQLDPDGAAPGPVFGDVLAGLAGLLVLGEGLGLSLRKR